MSIFNGNFTFKINGECITEDEVKKFIDSNMSVTISGTVVNFVSPKKSLKQDAKLSLDSLKSFMINGGSTEKDLTDIIYLITAENKEDLGQRFAEIRLKNSAPKKDKITELLEEVDKHQEQNGGRVTNMEFPFDAILTPTREECGRNGRYFDREAREKKIIEDWNRIDLDGLRNENESFEGGIKETEGKLHYELSWEFIEEMAKRMANNKSDKYPLYNWKKSINVQDLKDAINRHHIEVMKGNYKDGDEVLGHIVSYACNAMMLWEQLNKK